MSFDQHAQLRAELVSSALHATGDDALFEVEDVLVDADFKAWADGPMPHYMVELLRAALSHDAYKAALIANDWLAAASKKYADEQLALPQRKLELVR